MVACGWNKVASPMATYVDSWIVNLYAGFMCTSVRFQNLTHVIRGGFFVVRNDLEEEIGWDFGTIFTAEDFRLARILDNKKEPTQVHMLTQSNTIVTFSVVPVNQPMYTKQAYPKELQIATRLTLSDTFLCSFLNSITYRKANYVPHVIGTG